MYHNYNNLQLPYYKARGEAMAREIKKIERINKAQRTKHKKKSLFSRIIGAFKFKS